MDFVLRKTAGDQMKILSHCVLLCLQNAPLNEPVYQFMDKKRAEGNPYRVYMMASANKFLRIYYATVKAYLESLEQV